MKSVVATVVALSVGLSLAMASESSPIRVTRVGSQPSGVGAEQNFSGSVRVDSRFEATQPARVGGAIVTFEPGARTAWHTHPLGQTLIVTTGVGRVQKWADDVQEIRPGDVVWIPPGVKHWHGASPGMGMSHVAISERLDGKSVDWLEKVSDTQYATPKTLVKKFRERADAMYLRLKPLAIVIISAAMLSGCANLHNSDKPALMLADQGSFAVGGRIITQPGTFDPIKQGAFNPAGPDTSGQTLHGDHGYVFYQIPVNAKKLPLVFWHGGGQFSKTWETTPDGREGYQNIFLRRRFPVYLVDQPRRGNAGRATQPGTISAAADEQMLFGLFRLGIWPNFHEGVQFSRDPEALNQFFRQATPDTAPRDNEANVIASSALLNKIGKAVLVTHSASGTLGWRTVLKNDKVRAVISYEPGGDFIFPEGEKVEAMKLGPRTIEPARVPLSDFMAFTKIPIVIYYGDNIPDEPSAHPALEQWRVFRRVAQQWADVVNRHGGNATVVQLPKIGIKGNTHFPFSDLNNIQIADLMSQFLSRNGLD